MLCFLWLKSPHDVESEVLELRFTHPVFGLRLSPAILGCMISNHLDKYQSRHPEVIQSIKNSFYIDDLISGGDTVEEAFNTYLVANKAMSGGGFNLRKWNSNSPELISRITSANGQPARDSAVDNSQKGDGARTLSVYCWI